jgi:hypothetical protein
MQQPTSAPLGLRDLERGAALAKTQGSLQASQILIASLAFDRNPPQVDSARIRQPMVSVKAWNAFCTIQNIHENDAAAEHNNTIQSIMDSRNQM